MSETELTPDQQRLAALKAEGETLLVQRDCHKMRNEMAALILLAKLWAPGVAVPISIAEGCLERMRITVATGQYPEHLLDP